MLMAKVIGSVCATHKYESLEGEKLLIVQPLHVNMTRKGKPIVVTDVVDCGYGEVVFIITSAEAVVPTPRSSITDGTIIGVIDKVNLFE